MKCFLNAVIPGLLGLLLTAVTAPVQAQFPAIDTTFGTAGEVSTNMSPTAADDIPHAVHVRPDGRIIVGGRCGSQFCVARYLSDGSPDSSFGPVATPGKALLTRLGEDRAFTTAVQSDGRIVMAGDCRMPLGVNIGFCIVRLTADGLPDPGFGDAGWVDGLAMSSAYDGARAIALLPQGKLLVSGECVDFASQVRSFCHVRLLSNGSLDTSFNGTGKLITPYNGNGLSGNNKYVTASVVRDDGMIFIVGYSETSGDDRILVLRMTPTGGIGIWQVIDADTGSDRAWGAALQVSGRLLVSGECGNRACLLRLNADDSGLDAGYGTAGKLLVEDASVSAEGVGAVALLPDGSAMFAGWRNPVAGICSGLLRWVGSSGARQALVNQPFCTPLRVVALQADLKPVVAFACGTSGNRDFCVRRYQAPSTEFRNCSLDVDGDGAVRATTDSLIAARVALGMTGAAVTSGISFESHALRKTWPDIRNWMVNHCGLELP